MTLPAVDGGHGGAATPTGLAAGATPDPISRTAADLVARLGGELRGDPARRVSRVASLERAAPDALAFVASARWRARLADTAAGIVVVPPALAAEAPAAACTIVHPDPYAWYARAAQLFAALAQPPFVSGIDAAASVADGASVAASARVAPRAVIEAGAIVGERCSIGPGCVVGRGARIGDDTVLVANVVVYHDCVVGARCLVHAGAVIGADGFGFAPSGGQWVKIPQTGRAVIGDDVEIGANTTIDRGALDDTVIGDGCKLDNQIQVAHNVRIGAHTAIAACAGIAGSARIGAHCMIGGSAGILGHLEICDRVTISAMSLVTRSISEPGFYTGVFPLMSNRDWERSAAVVRQLEPLRRRVRALERALPSAPRASEPAAGVVAGAAAAGVAGVATNVVAGAAPPGPAGAADDHQSLGQGADGPARD